MSTGFNPQYQQYPQTMPQQMQPMQPMQQMQPAQSYTAQAQGPTASAVNIQIFNPTATTGAAPAQAPATAYAQPMAPMYQAAPMYQPAPPLYQTSSLYGPQGNGVSYPMNYNAPINQTNYNMAPSNTEATDKKDDKKADKKKEKVILTDDYIKSLENYLNNQDAKIRLTAAKELLERFKEDDKRKQDPALCALLNKVIQDPKASVRYIGLTTLDTGYALGNEETVSILKQLQNRPDLEYGEDARLAAEILLKMSGQTVTVEDNSSTDEGAKKE